MVYEKFVEAQKNKDIEAYLDCYHEEWQITFHSTGRIMRLEELSDQIGNWMVTGKFEKHRCLYENEDILVTHNIATFEDGSREATLQSHRKKDGLLWRTETGATPLKKESN